MAGQRLFPIQCKLLALAALLALLVCNTAGSFACRLAGSLAFAAATVLNGFSQIAGIQSLDSSHGSQPPYWKDITGHPCDFGAKS